MRPYLIVNDAEPRAWRKATLRELGQNETFLEKIVAASPSVLGLDPYETGITKTVVSFRQTHLPTPTGRTVKPDVVLLSESGHVVIVEAKLADNPELKDRAVVAQVVEYAASVANLSDDDLLRWLQAEEGESWNAFIRRTFPAAEAPDLLAGALRRRMRNAELHLVIVCDGAPDGLRDLVKSVAGQAALGAFKLHVVELAPHVVDGVAGVLLVPASVVQTEIVARTAITVSYVDGKPPGVSVVASSAEEVEEAIEDVRTGRTMRPEFAAVIEQYNATAPDDLQAVGRSAAYRQIRPPEWPGGIHYEFLDRSGGQENVGVEFHVEKPSFGHLTEHLAELAQTTGARHSPDWYKGGRLVRQVPVGDAEAAASAMISFIRQTRATITRLLAGGNVTQG